MKRPEPALGFFIEDVCSFPQSPNNSPFSCWFSRHFFCFCCFLLFFFFSKGILFSEMVYLRHMDWITELGSSRIAVLPRICLQLLKLSPPDGFAINGEIFVPEAKQCSQFNQNPNVILGSGWQVLCMGLSYPGAQGRHLVLSVCLRVRAEELQSSLWKLQSVLKVVYSQPWSDAVPYDPYLSGSCKEGEGLGGNTGSIVCVCFAQTPVFHWEFLGNWQLRHLDGSQALWLGHTWCVFCNYDY